MAATKANQKVIEKEVDELIECITSFSPEEDEDLENFELCRRYVLSNVYYHRFLDTNSHDVRRQLQGISAKLRVHALPQRGDRLQLLWQELVQREEWSQNAQWDIEWRLLSLLVNLSHQPTSLYSGGAAAAAAQAAAAASGGGACLPPAVEAPELEIDWEEELRPPPQHHSPYQSPEEWSSSEDEYALLDASRPSSARSGPLFGPAAGGDAGAAGWEPPADGQVGGDDEEEDAYAWLESQVAPLYEPQPPDRRPLRPQPDAAETFHHFQQRLGLAPGAPPTKLPEWAVCREVVWQLLCPTDSPLFRKKQDTFTPGTGFRVQGLTEAAFCCQLARFCRPISALHRLRRFAREPGGEKIPATHQAFAAALASHLRKLDSELAAVERELIQQVETVTVLSLEARLTGWTAHVCDLDRIHHQGVAWASGDRPAWVRSARLVSVLYESAQTCADARWSPSLLRLFLDTLQPLLSVAAAWMVSETDPDPGREFFIERHEETAVTDTSYWSCGFTVHSNSVEWWQDEVEPLPFLLPHLPAIVQTAKCLRMLCHLKMTADIDDSSMQEEFNKSMNAALSIEESSLCPIACPVGSSESELALALVRPLSVGADIGALVPLGSRAGEEVPALPSSDDAEAALLPARRCSPECDARSEDSGRGSAAAAEHPSLLLRLLEHEALPYLTAAFADTVRVLEEPEYSPTEQSAAEPRVDLTTCLPRLLERALVPAVARRCSAVGRRTLAALRDDYRLLEHLRTLRRVYLMEAGDLMAAFSQQLFATLRSESVADESVRLTLGLEDCISGRYPEMAARFSVSAGRPDTSAHPLERLGAVRLAYAVPWPATIVITEQSLQMYSQMFTFILQLKYTLRTLQALHFKDLGEDGPSPPRLDFSVVSGLGLGVVADGATVAPPATSALRLQLLRAWLLHFVGNIHSYIMMRVLHSTSLELEERLEKATDIDSIVQAHSTYISVLHRRCLLSGAAERHLHAAVQDGLRTCLQLADAWRRGAAAVTEETLVRLEAEYVRCHRLVAGLLKQYRRSMSHVDSLAAVMAHSSPCQVPLGELG